MRSGYVNVSIPALRNAGQNGYDWSSRSYSTTTNAYSLNFNASDVNPSNYNNRWNGFPLRWFCTPRRVPIFKLMSSKIPSRQGERGFDHSWSDQDITNKCYTKSVGVHLAGFAPLGGDNRSLTQLTAASNVVASSSSDGTSGNYATSNRSWTSSWKFWHDSWLFWFFWSWFIRRSWGLTNLV